MIVNDQQIYLQSSNDHKDCLRIRKELGKEWKMEHHKLLSQRQRHQMLMKQLMDEGIVRVDEASVHFGVSAITIRRDLDFLQKQGLLERIHGGALPLKNQQQELS